MPPPAARGPAAPPAPAGRFGRAASVAAAAGWTYLAGVVLWFALSRLAGDVPGYLGLLTSLALYLFVPLPVVGLAAILAKRRALLAGAVAAAAIFIGHWGALFLPPASRAYAGGPALSVMTFNGLGRNGDLGAFLDIVEHEHADIVCLQELSHPQADSLAARFAARYPHRLLEPRLGVRGMGVMSRHPLRILPGAFPSAWRCANQTLAVDWMGREVRLVNFHFLPFPEDLRDAGAVTRSFARREREAEALARYVDALPESVLVVAAGDANISSTNRAYRVLTGVLDDAWREAGFGFGHTFPNRDAAGHGGIRRIGFPPPSWLVRIDYVLHSGWRTRSVHTARSAGGSDHRGVVAVLSPIG